MFKGDVDPKDVTASVANIKTRKTIEFADWCPTGFKCGLNYQQPTVVPGSDIAKTTRSACMISNSTSIKGIFSKICRKWDSMYRKRAFVHWYTGIGIRDECFDYARYNIAELIKDY